ncbi:MAG: hypothetical protein V2B19_15825 [Pseudomonadota bacterium]
MQKPISRKRIMIALLTTAKTCFSNRGTRDSLSDFAVIYVEGRYVGIGGSVRF